LLGTTNILVLDFDKPTAHFSGSLQMKLAQPVVLKTEASEIFRIDFVKVRRHTCNPTISIKALTVLLDKYCEHEPICNLNQ